MANRATVVAGPASLVVLIAACVPTAARKNARLEPGFDTDLTAGIQYMGEGEDEDGNPTEGGAVVEHFEVDLQWAATYADRSGIALQLKLPINFFFTSVDAYYQIPGTHPQWFFGFGAELGIASGVYAVATHYLSEELYVSLTPRVLSGIRSGEIQINPQLSLGFAGPVDVSAFVSYAYHTGRGINVAIDLSGDGDRDWRKRYALMGASIRF